jgi:hypothetical protein
VPFDIFLKIHSNPFLVDKESEYKRRLARQVGRDTLLNSICNDLVDFFDQQDSSDSNNAGQTPYIAAVLGELGSGKTLFGRCIFDNIKRRKGILGGAGGGSDFKPILTSSLNAESQMKFLGIWRPVFQMMLTVHCRKNNLSMEATIRRYLKGLATGGSSEEIHDVVLAIFELPDLKTSGALKLPLVQDPI